MSRAAGSLLGFVLLLTAAAGAVGFGGAPDAGRDRRAREFDRLTGEIGAGPTWDAAGCEFGPQVGLACDPDTRPGP